MSWNQLSDQVFCFYTSEQLCVSSPNIAIYFSQSLVMYFLKMVLFVCLFYSTLVFLSFKMSLVAQSLIQKGRLHSLVLESDCEKKSLILIETEFHRFHDKSTFSAESLEGYLSRSCGTRKWNGSSRKFLQPFSLPIKELVSSYINFLFSLSFFFHFVLSDFYLQNKMTQGTAKWLVSWYKR